LSLKFSYTYKTTACDATGLALTVAETDYDAMVYMTLNNL